MVSGIPVAAPVIPVVPLRKQTGVCSFWLVLMTVHQSELMER